MRSVSAAFVLAWWVSTPAFALGPSGLEEKRGPEVQVVPPELGVRELPAKPATKTIAILVISGEELGFALSEIYGDARRVIEAETTLNVAPLDAISIGERAQVVRECAGRAECFAEKFRAAGGANINLLLTVSADRLENGFLLGFRLVDVDNSRGIGSAGDEIPVGMSLLGAMEQQLGLVFPKEIWGQISSAEISSSPDSAEVLLAGRTCVSPCTLARLPPGEHDVVVRKEGFLPWQSKVVLKAHERAQVAATLSEPERGLLSSWIFWTAIGAVVLGGAAAAVIATRPQDRIVKICVGPEDSACP